MTSGTLSDPAAYVPDVVKRVAHDFVNPWRFRQAHIERGCWISRGSSLGVGVRLGEGVRIKSSHVGDYSYIGRESEVQRATVGRYCSIAADVAVGLGDHLLGRAVSTHPMFFLRRPANGWNLADRDYQVEYAPTTLGHDVWLGQRALVKSGTTIGHGAVVAAGAVVVKDVPPYAIVGGVPARLIRMRFEPGVIDFLLDFKWWERGADWVRANWKQFHDIDSFVDEHKRD